ncbi:MAG: hypothetical protein R8M38_04425 [Mariprofundaceae bacterium]
MNLQASIDYFLSLLQEEHQDALPVAVAESCMEMFIDYIAHFSDLAAYADESEEMPLNEWEEELENNMDQLLDGDIDLTPDLSHLQFPQLDCEHFRDFFAWYLLREEQAAIATIGEHAVTLKAWLDVSADKGWLNRAEHLACHEVIDDALPEAVRTSKAAQLLLHFVRLGSGIAPRLRGKRFSEFVEGHARISKIEPAKIYLGFDNQTETVGPIQLPESLIALMQLGDVLDVELGLRAKTWLIVDIGPIYPAMIYIESESFDIPEKQL